MDGRVVGASVLQVPDGLSGWDGTQPSPALTHDRVPSQSLKCQQRAPCPHRRGGHAGQASRARVTTQTLDNAAGWPEWAERAVEAA